jgi:hypothetical protein
LFYHHILIDLTRSTKGGSVLSAATVVSWLRRLSPIAILGDQSRGFAKTATEPKHS